ncbi:MAG: 23S rRNA (adenine(2030)-N(6))-methyltransferase RlmJ [Alphaproteobacteria bacterium]|nr:23S rRNA (adenine(2030)-N(6))-methyltransferase RlmJ [Alphaproteobacteria bacterium]
MTDAAEPAASDYDHRFHAANHADVWKHTCLLALLASVRRAQVAVVDTHGGHGGYRLPAQGEWNAGLGRLLDAVPPGASTASGAVDRYLGRVRRLAPDLPRSYPGSPRLTLDALSRTSRLRVHEIEPQALSALRAALAGDGRAQVVGGDGLAALDALPTADEVVVVIDPPFVAKAEWDTVADAVVRCVRAHPHARVFLWYPVKRWSRPRALQARLSAAGVPWVALDLVVTPMEVERSSLGGSGVLLVNAPSTAVAEMTTAGAVLGPLLATHDGRWSLVTSANGGAL